MSALCVVMEEGELTCKVRKDNSNNRCCKISLYNKVCQFLHVELCSGEYLTEYSDYILELNSLDTVELHSTAPCTSAAEAV